MFTVGKRIGLGYLLMASLVVGIGLAGLLAVDRIDSALKRISGPVDAPARAVDKGIRGVLLQMIGVDRALTGQGGPAQAQIAAATHEMTRKVSHVADSASEALESANHARQEANAGQAIIGDTLAAIRTLGGQVESAAATMQSLEQESDAIGGVIDVIEGIAEQTNLLALNAAIEAARAGEHGRGFSVVADEVRTLANRTRQSTAQILGLVEGLQTRAREAAREMNENSAMAQGTVDQGEKAQTSFGSIVESVASIQGRNQAIARAATEQLAVAKDISRSLARINSDGEELLADNDKLSDAARSLSGLSQQLEGLLSQFRT
jgi:methyl-accepting chemotaxis protein